MTLRVISESRAFDAAILALSDAAAAAEDLDAWLIVGGHMVNLHVLRAEVDLPQRAGRCDQQIPMEKAFSSPYVLKQRLGHDLDAREIATFGPAAFEAIVAKPPALHRFPRANPLRRAFVGHGPGVHAGHEAAAKV